MSMKGNVDLIKDIEVGVDFLHSQRSYDVILQVVLDDAKALEDYQNDEYHCSVVKKHMHQVQYQQDITNCIMTIRKLRVI